MKKTYFALIILPTILFVIPIVFYFFSNNSESNNTENFAAKEPIFQKSENAKKQAIPIDEKKHRCGFGKNFASVSPIKGYMIKSEKENIYIYELYDNGFSEKIKTLDINPMFLRETDRKELEKGIERSSYEEICSLIEDYSS